VLVRPDEQKRDSFANKMQKDEFITKVSKCMWNELHHFPHAVHLRLNSQA